MFSNQHVIKSVIELLNQHFEMTITLGEENVPFVTSARLKTEGAAANFLNELIQTIDQGEGLEGQINYYFDNELDYDTPEEFHRH